MTHMTQEQKDKLAQEKYGKNYDDLDTNEKKAVGGAFRAQELGHEGYSEMAKHGGHHTSGGGHKGEEAEHAGRGGKEAEQTEKTEKTEKTEEHATKGGHATRAHK